MNKRNVKTDVSSALRPLSFRKVSMRNIGAALYPAYRPCGMTNAARGFTLIELLVVVLIIGILAAVALPQYQKAVEKSRSTQAISLVKSVYQAAETYYMEHGVWPSKFTDLDLEIPWNGTVQGWDTPGDFVSNDDWSLQIRTHPNFRGIFAVRLSGPYRGGMFVMYFDGVVSGQQRRLMCGELKTGDFNFQKTAGDFCNRVWQGKLLLEGDNTRLYSLNV